MTLNPVLVDFESQSRCDLKTRGGRRYWADPSTRPLCCAYYDTATGQGGVWFHGQPNPAPGRQLAAHNAMGFDRFGAETLGWTAPDHTWVDTSELARRAGLPGALDALGTRWLGLAKDKDASRFTTALSSVKRPTTISAKAWAAMGTDERKAHGLMPQVTDADMARVVPYCCNDVNILVHGWPRLAQWADLEPAVQAAERAVNDRGVYFDQDLAKALLVCDQINGDQAVSQVARELGWTTEQVRAAARSPKQFCEHTGAANAQKGTLASLDHPLVRARQALASIASGKLEAGLARVCPDSRLRDTHRYYGAHTGRWSGRGMQLQNMPRPDKQFEEWTDGQLCTLADQVKAGRIATQAEIDLLLRATICAAPGHALVVRDFSGVEARFLAWVAGDLDALDVFASKRDPYKVAAGTIFGVPYEHVTKEQRQVGKIAELACGYGQGGKKFAETAAKMGANLERAGVNASAVVAAWRRQHAPIVRFWDRIEKAFKHAIWGQDVRVDRFRFLPLGDAIAIILPSGRPIMYNGARVLSDGSLEFDGPHGPEYTYGGKLVENITQGGCRELLADALVRAEAWGLRPIMHIHDEIGAEVPAQAVQEGGIWLQRAMCELSPWAEGFPVGAAGFEGTRYRK